MALLREASLVIAAAFVVAGLGGADPPLKTTKVEPLGVYFLKTKDGVWLVTYARGGTGTCESKLIVDGKVGEDRYDFWWSMKNGEVVQERISDDPDQWVVEHLQFLPDDSIRPRKVTKDGKLLRQSPKDAPALEFLGLDGRPKRDTTGDPAKPEAQAKAAVQEYIKAMRAKDLDRLSNVAEVPWLDFGNRIISDRAELTKWLKRKLDAVGDSAAFPSEVLRVQKYGEIRDGIKSEEVRKLADQVLNKDDWVVTVGRKGVVYNSHFVRISGGKAKVIGFEK